MMRMMITMSIMEEEEDHYDMMTYVMRVIRTMGSDPPGVVGPIHIEQSANLNMNVCSFCQDINNLYAIKRRVTKCLYVRMSVGLSLFLLSVCLCLYLAILSPYVCLCMSPCLSICLSVCMHAHVDMQLSHHLIYYIH